jgi:opacity protein-like surface antigen
MPAGRVTGRLEVRRTSAASDLRRVCDRSFLFTAALKRRLLEGKSAIVSPSVGLGERAMKNILIGIAAIIASVGTSAFAADMPLKAPPPPPAPAWTWTGFYAGLNAGGAFDDGSFATTGTPVSFNPAGLLMGAPATMNALAAVLTSNAPRSGSQFIGGGQFGYNFQFTSAYVLGFEADIQALAGSGRTSSAVTTSSFAPFGFPANNYGRPPRSRSASII